MSVTNKTTLDVMQSFSPSLFVGKLVAQKRTIEFFTMQRGKQDQGPASARPGGVAAALIEGG
ncbi:MAG: hypothetical protein JO182_15050 [Acidobacteriaceae bacterium]|nr:hypothetical protein [Acidobacteriaceae bacterium]